MIRTLDRAALAATLLLPVFVMHGRGLAEAMIAVIDLCFLVRSVLCRDWRWTRAPWVRIAAAFWLWLIVCSLPGVGIGGVASLVQAVAIVRLLLLPAALGDFVLATPRARRWLHWVLTASALYIIGQTVLQLVIGRDIQGFPRNGDGELTGPFQHPRAATPLSRLLYPVLLPPVAALLGRRRRLIGWIGAAGLTVASIMVMVLIGQRMPLLLTLLGLAISALMLRRVRSIAVIALCAGGVLLAASAAIEPPTFYRLVTKFSTQMSDFPDSAYGVIYGRAIAIVAAHPLFGQGYDGFRDACADRRYFVPLPWQHSADGGGLAGCNIHPHNHYLEAATEAGLPGLVLFAALVGAWWAAVLRGIGRDPDPLRVGIFASVVMAEWPLASTSNFTSIEASGFFLILLGYGLALARAAERVSAMSPELSMAIM